MAPIFLQAFDGKELWKAIPGFECVILSLLTEPYMKRTGTILALVLLCASGASAQVPNGGFETWTNGSPDNWLTDNAAPVYVTVSQSTNAHSGAYAASGQVPVVFNVPIAPWLQAGTGGQGFHASGRPAVITGWYQLTSVGGDKIVVAGWLMQGGTTLIAVANDSVTAAASSYKQFSVPFVYGAAGNADSAYIEIALTNDGSAGVHSGTSFLIDDIALSGTSAVGPAPGTAPKVFALDQNYPNPFNPTTTIGYDVPSRSHVMLTVFNMLGEQVKQLVNDDVGAGHYSVQFSANGLPSGMYFYRLQAENFVQTRTLMLVK